VGVVILIFTKIMLNAIVTENRSIYEGDLNKVSNLKNYREKLEKVEDTRKNYEK